MLALLVALQAGGGTIPAPSTSALPLVERCSVIDQAPRRAMSGGAGQLVGICGNRGVPLGSADRYSTVSNVLTGSVLVVRRQAGRTQVLLISPTLGGVAVDDVTRDLTRLTGRFGDLGLGSAEVDSSRFAIDGSVGVVATGGARWLDLRPFIQLAAKIVTAPLQGATQTGGANN